MPEHTPLYDLMLLLSTEAPDDQRAKILADVESAISAGGGSIERRAEWGTRTLSYRIRHEPEAQYHLLQFTCPPTLLESLTYNLRITDGVLRFRIIKVVPGTPAAPETPPPLVAPVATGGGGREASPPAEAEG
jgi:small subunit ribosomal protein S6